jgi:putative heme iron utilization protein
MRMVTDAHGRPSGGALSFTDDDVKAPSHAERARTLVAAQKTGTLCTLALEPAGYPYGSFVTFALHDGQPVFLISRIAEHTRNLAADGRASLLVHEAGKADPLANGRVTLIGPCARLARDAAELPAVRETFLAAHANAGYYVDYADFDFWRLELSAVRFIGGYGRMSWVTADDFRRAEPDPMLSASARVLDHMNQDHADSLLLYARAFTRARSPEKAVMTAIDRYGFEMTITTPDGVGPARLACEQPIANAQEARTTLVALVRAAEAKLA